MFLNYTKWFQPFRQKHFFRSQIDCQIEAGAKHGSGWRYFTAPKRATSYEVLNQWLLDASFTVQTFHVCSFLNFIISVRQVNITCFTLLLLLRIFFATLDLTRLTADIQAFSAVNRALFWAFYMLCGESVTEITQYEQSFCLPMSLF